MRICISTMFPGAPAADVARSLEDSDLLDIYDIDGYGHYALTAQIRNCGGMCRDDIETIIRRGVRAVIIRSLRPDARFRLERASIDVLLAEDGPAKFSLEKLPAKGLRKLPRPRSENRD